MATTRNFWLVRWFILVCLVVVVISVISQLLIYPAVLGTAGPQAFVFITLFLGAILFYAWFGYYRVRTGQIQNRDWIQVGTLCGILCGVAWVIELGVANLLGPQYGIINNILYFGSTIFAYLVPGTAGILITLRTKKFAMGLQGALLAGMLGGLIVFLAAIIFTPILQQANSQDPQTIKELARSGIADMTVYFVGDLLVAMTGHLWIGLISGFVFGSLGAGIGLLCGKAIPIKLKQDNKGN